MSLVEPSLLLALMIRGCFTLLLVLLLLSLSLSAAGADAAARLFDDEDEDEDVDAAVAAGVAAVWWMNGIRFLVAAGVVKLVSPFSKSIMSLPVCISISMSISLSPPRTIASLSFDADLDRDVDMELDVVGAVYEIVNVEGASWLPFDVFIDVSASWCDDDDDAVAGLPPVSLLGVAAASASASW
jgi:hypothetical protein